jgi:hypothetical protein
MKTAPLISALLFCLSPVLNADTHKTSAADIVASAKRECASFEGGEFNATKQAILLQDLTGDGKPEELVDGAQFSCSTSASMWGGTGGTYLWVIVDGQKYEFLAHKWRVVSVDEQKVLLLAVHSSECSDIIGPCYRALVWSKGFRTIR